MFKWSRVLCFQEIPFKQPLVWHVAACGTKNSKPNRPTGYMVVSGFEATPLSGLKGSHKRKPPPTKTANPYFCLCQYQAPIHLTTAKARTAVFFFMFLVTDQFSEEGRRRLAPLEPASVEPEGRKDHLQTSILFDDTVLCPTPGAYKLQTRFVQRQSLVLPYVKGVGHQV